MCNRWNDGRIASLVSSAEEKRRQCEVILTSLTAGTRSLSSGISWLHRFVAPRRLHFSYENERRGRGKKKILSVFWRTMCKQVLENNRSNHLFQAMFHDKEKNTPRHFEVKTKTVLFPARTKWEHNAIQFAESSCEQVLKFLQESLVARVCSKEITLAPSQRLNHRQISTDALNYQERTASNDT